VVVNRQNVSHNYQQAQTEQPNEAVVYIKALFNKTNSTWTSKN